MYFTVSTSFVSLHQQNRKNIQFKEECGVLSHRQVRILTHNRPRWSVQSTRPLKSHWHHGRTKCQKLILLAVEAFIYVANLGIAHFHDKRATTELIPWDARSLFSTESSLPQKVTGTAKRSFSPYSSARTRIGQLPPTLFSDNAQPAIYLKSLPTTAQKHN